MNGSRLEAIGADHPSVAVQNPAGMVDWYCTRLGYVRFAGEGDGPYLLRAADGTFLEVMKQDGTPRPPRTNFTPGWSHLGIRVRDLEAAIAFLESQGVSWTGGVGKAVGGGQLRNFADPEGNSWQIVQR